MICLSNLIRLTRSRDTYQTCAVPAQTTSVLGAHCLTILTLPGEAINPTRFSSVHAVDVGDVRAERTGVGGLRTTPEVCRRP